jgi:nanoRNase/pAp phosphatase (c-di-AMP/oligoRNAs hydrolase)
VSIICHHNADPDAIGAAYGIQRLIGLLTPSASTEILYPDTASQLSVRVMERFSINASKSPRLGDAKTVVVVDTGSLVQLETLITHVKDATKRIFIDHHGKNNDIEQLANIYVSDEDAVATCEIVFNIWASLGLEPPMDVAEILLVGIIFDSKHFGIGTPNMFKVVARLIELGASLNDARELLQASMDQSERIARLKSAQRARVYRIDRWLVVTANLGSFQASAARGMMNLGADIAIIAGNDKKTLKTSIRSNDDFHKKTGIHVGDDFSKKLAELFAGEGGGHPTAAGVNGVGDADDFLAKAVVYLAEKLGKPAQVL